MSNYFNNFPKVLYLFGDEDQPVSYQNLLKYSDLIDTLRDRLSAYIEYEIKDFERPDTLSYRFYGTDEYEWTFFLMNERLRETGWPLSLNDLYEAAEKKYFKNYTAKLDLTAVINSGAAADSAEALSLFADLYPAGEEILINGVAGTVVSKKLNVSEIVISSDDDITTSTILRYATPDPASPLTGDTVLTNTVYEYEGTHHYENDSGEWVNIILDSPLETVNAIPKTNLEHLVDENDKSKRIRIIKKQEIDRVVSEYKRLLEIN